MLVVAKAHVGSLQLAEAFDIDRGKTVDQDIGHAMVGQQWFQRTQTEHFVGDLLDDQLTTGRAYRRRMLIEQTLADITYLPRGFGLLERIEQGQVDETEQLLVDFI